MATRMQQRRGTAAQWTAANPILAAGEIGFETDTSKFKMGNGSSNWASLQYFANAAELTNIIDGAPDLLNTLNELAAAMGDNPDFLTLYATIELTEDAIAESRSDAAADATAKANAVAAAAALDATGKADAARAAAIDAAETALSSHEADTTSVHGIPDTSLLATTSYADDAVSVHNTDETNVHGIADTALLATKDYADDAVSTAVLALTPETIGLENVDNTSDADKPVSTAQATAISTAVSDHNAETENVHGIADTAELVTQTQLTNAISGAEVDQSALAGVGLDWNSGTDQFDIDETHITTSTQSALDLKAPLADPTFTGTVSGVTAGMVGLGYVENTADADKPVSTATQTALDAKLNLAGGTMTGALTLSGAPSSSLHAATKQYVDNTASGVIAKPQVLGATVANVDATYSNGTAGVGATLTHNTNGEFPADAGGASGWAVGKGILVKNQTNKEENGRYYVSDMGSASTPYILTRCTYCDEASEIPGAYIFVQDGTFAGTGWIQVVADPATFVVGTDNIDVFQFSGSGTITEGTNISVSGNEISVVDAPTFSGAVTASSGIVFSDGTQTKVGVPSITTFGSSFAANGTLAAGEQDKFIPVAGTVTITLPATGYSTGQSIDFYQASGTGAQFASTNSVVGTPGLKFRTTNSVVTAMKTSSGWLVFGDLSA